MTCPCGLGASYETCCAPVHQDAVPASTAERVMRARYSAFVVGDEADLVRSWHPATRPRTIGMDPTTEWLGLDVIAVSGGGVFDSDGTVEFIARHRRGGRTGAVHERSRFVRHQRQWVYLDAVEGDGLAPS